MLACNKYKCLLSALTAICMGLTSCKFDEKENTQPETRMHSRHKQVDNAAPNICLEGQIIPSQDGKRRIAVIIGIDQYVNKQLPHLQAASADAKRVYELFTAKRGGYTFPKENVCLIQNKQASAEKLKDVLGNALKSRLRNNDILYIYFAGLGGVIASTQSTGEKSFSQVLLPSNANEDLSNALTDSELTTYIKALTDKDVEITLIIDACSQSTFKSDSNYTARCISSTDITTPVRSQLDKWVDLPPKKTHIFAAAANSFPALERNGHGIFTDALLTVLSKASSSPLSLHATGMEIQRLVHASADQTITYQGDRNLDLFGGFRHLQPYAWKITQITPSLDISGPSISGLGIGSELRIYDNQQIKGDQFNDPDLAKATVVINRFSETTASVNVTSIPSSNKAFAIGDIAVPVRPADHSLKLAIRMRAPDAPGGISDDLAAELESHLSDNSEALNLLRLVRGAGDFEVSIAPNTGSLEIRGPEMRLRNSTQNMAALITFLHSHARQKALRLLQGQGGTYFADNHTLSIEHPYALGSSNATPLVVTNNAKIPLMVSGLILFPNGISLPITQAQRNVLLQPGDQHHFEISPIVAQTINQLNYDYELLLFGTPENNPVPWPNLLKTAAERGNPTKGLYRILDRYLTPGARGSSFVTSRVKETPWTLTSLHVTHID